MSAGTMAGMSTISSQKVEDANGLMADIDDDNDDNDKKALVQTSGSEETKGVVDTGQQYIRGEWFPSDAIDFSKWK